VDGIYSNKNSVIMILILLISNLMVDPYLEWFSAANIKGSLVDGLAINIALSHWIHYANYYFKYHFHYSLESKSIRGFHTGFSSVLHVFLFWLLEDSAVLVNRDVLHSVSSKMRKA